MQNETATRPPFGIRVLLSVSALIALTIGAAILLFPESIHARHGIDLAPDATLLSEVRAPGGALMALGVLMGVGVFAPAFTLASTSIAAAVYLAYGVSRLLSLAFDGMPDAGIVSAIAIELVLGLLAAAALVWMPREASAGARPKPRRRPEAWPMRCSPPRSCSRT